MKIFKRGKLKEPDAEAVKCKNNIIEDNNVS